MPTRDSVRDPNLSITFETLGKTKIRVFGLENNSFFCYLNSVLQCLFTLKEFR
jgi:ubiquitin C-terminal hydrolase